ncbi:MAG: AAA family ATPase [Simkaniaceae bacterium]|nr:AAA family ATPase [Candidatus Sacchlamyda saccharinae]
MFSIIVYYPFTYMKIAILGTCGSGKTTLAKRLSKEFGIPHVELDSLKWLPNWVEEDEDVFYEKAKEAVKGDNWVTDGNYSKVGHDLIWPRADVVIWLDYPLPIILYRLMKRILRRAFTKEVLWGGCQESLRMQFFSKRSIFVWAFKSYWKRRRAYPYLLSKYSNFKLIRVKRPQLLDLALKDDGGLKAADFVDADVSGNKADD